MRGAALHHAQALPRQRPGLYAPARDPDGARDIRTVLGHAGAAAIGRDLDSGGSDGRSVAGIVATLRPPERGGREHERHR